MMRLCLPFVKENEPERVWELARQLADACNKMPECIRDHQKNNIEPER